MFVQNGAEAGGMGPKCIRQICWGLGRLRAMGWCRGFVYLKEWLLLWDGYRRLPHWACPGIKASAQRCWLLSPQPPSLLPFCSQGLGGVQLLEHVNFLVSRRWKILKRLETPSNSKLLRFQMWNSGLGTLKFLGKELWWWSWKRWEDTGGGGACGKDGGGGSGWGRWMWMQIRVPIYSPGFSQLPHLCLMLDQAGRSQEQTFLAIVIGLKGDQAKPIRDLP